MRRPSESGGDDDGPPCADRLDGAEPGQAPSAGGGRRRDERHALREPQWWRKGEELWVDGTAVDSGKDGTRCAFPTTATAPKARQIGTGAARECLEGLPPLMALQIPVSCCHVVSGKPALRDRYGLATATLDTHPAESITRTPAHGPAGLLASPRQLAPLSSSLQAHPKAGNRPAGPRGCWLACPPAR